MHKQFLIADFQSLTPPSAGSFLGNHHDLQRGHPELEPGNQIRLYELDATRLGATLWCFHGHEHEGDIIWQGQLYSPIQIEASGFDIRGDGRPATPKLTLANELSGTPQ